MVFDAADVEVFEFIEEELEPDKPYPQDTGRGAWKY